MTIKAPFHINLCTTQATVVLYARLKLRGKNQHQSIITNFYKKKFMIISNLRYRHKTYSPSPSLTNSLTHIYTLSHSHSHSLTFSIHPYLFLILSLSTKIMLTKFTNRKGKLIKEMHYKVWFIFSYDALLRIFCQTAPRLQWAMGIQRKQSQSRGVYIYIPDISLVTT